MNLDIYLIKDILMLVTMAKRDSANILPDPSPARLVAAADRRVLSLGFHRCGIRVRTTICVVGWVEWISTEAPLSSRHK